MLKLDFGFSGLFIVMQAYYTAHILIIRLGKC